MAFFHLGNTQKRRGFSGLAIAASCGGRLLPPSANPFSKLYRVVNDESGLQADFMPVIHGVRSFAGLKSRATGRTVGGQTVYLATLEDIIKSKKAAGRSRDQAVIPVLEQTLRLLRSQ